MEKEGIEVTFDDINPFDKSPDRLTTMDEVKRELAELNSKREKREAEKVETERLKNEAIAEEKRLNEIRAEAEKMIEDKKAEN